MAGSSPALRLEFNSADLTQQIPDTSTSDISLARNLVRSVLLELAFMDGQEVVYGHIQMVTALSAKVALSSATEKERILKDLSSRRDLVAATARALIEDSAGNQKYRLTEIVLGICDDAFVARWEKLVDRRHNGIQQKSLFKKSLREANEGVSIYLELLKYFSKPIKGLS